MNPEAGLLQGPFRDAVERIAKARPNLPYQEVYRLARLGLPLPPPEPLAPPKPRVVTETPLELAF